MLTFTKCRILFINIGKMNLPIHYCKICFRSIKSDWCVVNANEVNLISSLDHIMQSSQNLMAWLTSGLLKCHHRPKYYHLSIPMGILFQSLSNEGRKRPSSVFKRYTSSNNSDGKILPFCHILLNILTLLY